MPNILQVRRVLLKAPAVVVAPSYTGPGDVKAGLTHYWGQDAGNAAYIGGNCVDIIRASDSVTQTFVIAANGFVDYAAIATFLTATTGKVSKLYDQVGTNHMVQATGANQPAFTLNAIGSLPGMTFSGNAWFDGSALYTQAQPFSVAYIAKRTAVNANFNDVLSSGSGGAVQFGFDTSSGNAFAYAGGTVITAPATENTFHDFQVAVNNTSSVLYLDGGTNSAAGIGTNGFNANTPSIGSSIGAVNQLTGLILRVGIWGGVTFSGPEAASLHSNAQTNWGV